jgi:nucleoside 2-deoxyribosyltransferase
MKIYLAGAWTDREQIHAHMITLVNQGHTITHDWTSYELVYNDKHERAKKCGRADLIGVYDADVVIALMTNDDYSYKGTRHELGAAFMLKELYIKGIIDKAPLIYIVCNGDPRTNTVLPECMHTCFEHLADNYFSTFSEVVKAL